MSSSLEKKIPFNINPVLKSQKKITGKKDDSFAKEWKIIFNGCTNIFNGKNTLIHYRLTLFEHNQENSLSPNYRGGG